MAGPDAVSTLKSYMVEFGDRETTSGWMERDERDRKKKKKGRRTKSREKTGWGFRYKKKRKRKRYILSREKGWVEPVTTDPA